MLFSTLLCIDVGKKFPFAHCSTRVLKRLSVEVRTYGTTTHALQTVALAIAVQRAEQAFPSIARSSVLGAVRVDSSFTHCAY
jgi:hypothetical protein